MFPKDARVDSKTEKKFREWLKHRTDKSFIHLITVGLVSGLFHVAFIPTWIVIALVYRWMGISLLKNGVVVPTCYLDKESNPFVFRDSAESYSGTMQTRDYGASESGMAVTATELGVNALTLFMGRFVPCVMVFFAFNIGDRTYRTAKSMFTAETFYRDEKGQAWAIVDPKHPLIFHWPVSRIPN